MKKIAGSPDLEIHPSIPVHWKLMLKNFADEFGYHYLANKLRTPDDFQQPLEIRQKDKIAWRHSFIDIDSPKSISGASNRPLYHYDLVSNHQDVTSWLGGALRRK